MSELKLSWPVNLTGDRSAVISHPVYQLTVNFHNLFYGPDNLVLCISNVCIRLNYIGLLNLHHCGK
jgi:hypothetical protein